MLVFYQESIHTVVEADKSTVWPEPGRAAGAVEVHRRLAGDGLVLRKAGL
jgi:hypothetical protein